MYVKAQQGHLTINCKNLRKKKHSTIEGKCSIEQEYALNVTY